ncbi:glycosyltransferase [Treponema sp. J25]|uniref:glycosyltransferase n=1 Tax=Treponema sp. J25 TaxID=2094121 RepID=UPI00104B0C95|nr:glycosyltransferase [Treponema sp. J25]TCW60161.1 glycosyl transferase family 2 [Treponema sp. J25]
MKTYVVTVTYGNRFNFLKQVIDSALNEGIKKIIVVDNNSVTESREKLKAYERELGKDKIKVLYLDENYGSAGGYKRGLEEAYNDPDCEFIWLLDDDNVPEENALRNLLLAYEYLGKNIYNVLMSLRPIFKDDLLSVQKGRIKGYIKNSFMGFHIKYYFLDKIFQISNYLNAKIGINSEAVNYKIVKSQIGPYGGLFLHKKVIENVGYPNEDFFVYADDHDWTLRMTNSGFDLYLCSNSIIKDIDVTWLATKVKSPFYNSMSNDIKVYYSIRNHVFLDKKFITNKYVYYLNLYISLFYNYLFHLFLIPKMAIKRFKIILKAVKDGLNGNLGRFC